MSVNPTFSYELKKTLVGPNSEHGIRPDDGVDTAKIKWSSSRLRTEAVARGRAPSAGEVEVSPALVAVTEFSALEEEKERTNRCVCA